MKKIYFTDSETPKKAIICDFKNVKSHNVVSEMNQKLSSHLMVPDVDCNLRKVGQGTLLGLLG